MRRDRNHSWTPLTISTAPHKTPELVSELQNRDCLHSALEETALKDTLTPLFMMPGGRRGLRMIHRKGPRTFPILITTQSELGTIWPKLTGSRRMGQLRKFGLKGAPGHMKCMYATELQTIYSPHKSVLWCFRLAPSRSAVRVPQFPCYHHTVGLQLPLTYPEPSPA